MATIVAVTVGVSTKMIVDAFKRGGRKITHAQAEALLKDKTFLETFAPDMAYTWEQFNKNTDDVQPEDVLMGLMGDPTANGDEIWTKHKIKPPSSLT